MKKIAITLIMVFLTLNIFSQTPNFFIDNSVWTYYTSESTEPGMLAYHTILEKDSIIGDTTINSLFYKKLFVRSQTTKHFLCSPCPSMFVDTVVSSEKYIRYDTLTKKVFLLEDTSTVEKCIYDFNLVVGDTTMMQQYGFPTYPYTIDSIKTILFFGSNVKKFYVSGGNSGDNFIIEGVGGSNGLTFFQPNEYVVSGGYYSTYLACFQSGDSIFNNGGWTCPSFVVVSIKENKLKKQVKIYPNPNNGSFEMVLDAPFQQANLTIFDLTGKVIIQQKITQNNTQLNLLSNPKGMYFYQLLVDGKQVTGKLIVQ
ncbi:MAG: T9SS type A sorting domain-containing protein [Vicingaceae bacterium]|nr:T9SS type A sorting domain-containing protein [Vicingaceae bacterium]